MNASREILIPGAPAGRSLEQIGERALHAADRIDIAGSVGFFRKRLGLIVTVVCVSLLIGALITALMDKSYLAESVVSLEPPDETHDTTTVTTNSGPAPNDAFVETQSQIIQSREMARRVAESLGWLKNKPADVRADVLDQMQANVLATRAGESYAVAIDYSGDTGEAAAAAANEYARQFTQWELLSIRERNAASIKTISARLAQLREQAESDTAALQHYRIANNLLTTSGSTLTEQEISSYNQAVTTAKAQVAEDQAALNTATEQVRSGSSDEVGEALNSSVVSALRSREAEVAGQVANFSARYGPNHPELIRAQGELAEIRRQIETETARVISNLRAKKAVSEQRLASLTNSLSSAKGQLSQNNSAMVGLDQLQRNADVSQALYEAYLNSYKQLAAGEGITEKPNARILTMAKVPLLPASPKVLLNMFLALVIGLGAGVAAAFFAENFFAGLSTAEDVRTKTGLHFLGSVPLLSSVSKTQRHEVRAITEEPRSVFAEAFRSLAASIDQAVFGPVEVVAITSAMPKEGKTITATCLAETLVIGGASVVLVDCDSVRHGVTSLLNLEKDHPGLFQLLDGEATLEETMISSSGGLSIIPMAAAGEKSESLLRDGSFEKLLAKLRLEFDYVILDLPPILPIAAARVMAAHADVTVMMVRWRKTNGGALQSALHMMANHRINIAGVALSQVDFRRRSLFGPNDPAFYFRGYKSYYS
jgi:uncharacterized protein involved in exopolysaccharide biosynthesis/Mrp family chromosome partitioning ATPase